MFFRSKIPPSGPCRAGIEVFHGLFCRKCFSNQMFFDIIRPNSNKNILHYCESPKCFPAENCSFRIKVLFHIIRPNSKKHFQIFAENREMFVKMFFLLSKSLQLKKQKHHFRTPCTYSVTQRYVHTLCHLKGTSLSRKSLERAARC